MTTATILKEQTIETTSISETPEEAKARRNAEYLAKLNKSLRELEEGKVFVTNIETLEAMTNEE